MLVIPVTPLVVRAHTTTNLHELKKALDAGRGGWRCSEGGFTDVVRVEIDGALLSLKGQNSMHRETDRETERQTDRQTA